MAELRTKFTADTKSFEAGANKVKGQIGGLNKLAIGLGATIAGAFAGAAVIGGINKLSSTLASGTRDILAYGAALDDLSMVTEIAVEDLVVLEQAFKSAGLGTKDIQKVVGALARQVSKPSKTLATAFDDMGLSLKDIQSMNAADQFKTVGIAIANVEDPTKRLYLSQLIFGKSLGQNLQVLFKTKNAFGDAETMVGSLAKRMGLLASDFAGLDDTIESLNTKKRQFFAGFTQGFLPTLKAINEELVKMDLGDIGVAFGKAFGEMLPDASQIDDFFKSMNGWLKDLPNQITNVADSLLKAFGPGSVFAGLTSGAAKILVNATVGPASDITALAGVTGLAGMATGNNAAKGLGALGMGYGMMINVGENEDASLMEKIGGGVMSFSLIASAAKSFKDQMKEMSDVHGGLEGVLKSFGKQIGLAAAAAGAFAAGWWAGNKVYDKFFADNNEVTTVFGPTKAALDRIAESNAQSAVDPNINTTGFLDEGIGLAGTMGKFDAAARDRLFSMINDGYKSNFILGPLNPYELQNVLDNNKLSKLLEATQKSMNISKDAVSFDMFNKYLPPLTSLARIGGATAFTKNPLVSLQQYANRKLDKIERNTRIPKDFSATFA